MTSPVRYRSLPCVVAFIVVASGCSDPSKNDDADGGPIVPPLSARTAFPLETPSLGGYKVVTTWFNEGTILPMAVIWPKVAGQGPFVLGRFGTIYKIDGNMPRQVLDIRSQVKLQQEGGALGMALHPNFGDGTGTHPYVYVWYNSVASTQRLSRFTWDPTARVLGNELMLIDQLEEKGTVHNAGRMAFGLDGFLYFGNGDDASIRNHQTISRALFAGIFRIDVDMQGGAVSHPPPRTPDGATIQGYFIPNDNPFVGVPNALEEYYAVGLRNPFAISFDRMTGALYAADVGETWREEINLITKGANYEWPAREGDVTVGPTPITIGTPQGPAYAYSHAEMGELASIIGGFVYRGSALPELQGKYIYSDWPSTRVWAVDLSGPTPKRSTIIDIPAYGDAIGFAEDNDGELYLLRENKIAKIVRDTPMARVPAKLSDTVLLRNLDSAAPAPGFVPYDVVSVLWSDGAEKRRFIKVPEGQRVTADPATGKLTFPVGTVILKQFDLPRDAMGRSRRLETRAIVVGSTDIYGVTYRWNADGTEGELVTEPAEETLQFATEPTTQTWSYPSYGQCWSCHRKENRVLGFTLEQLNSTKDGKSQLESLVAAGVLDAAAMSAPRKPLITPSKSEHSLEERAMSYLAANCSHCHHEDVFFHGGAQTWIATPGVALADRELMMKRNRNPPVAERLGIPNSMLIAPGDPAKSFLLQRMKTTDPDLRMPPLGRSVVDPAGAQVVEEWIRSLAP